MAETGLSGLHRPYAIKSQLICHALFGKSGFILGDDLNSGFNDFTVNSFPFKSCFCFQLFSLFRYFFPPAKVNIIRCDIADSLMVSLIIIPTDKLGYFLLSSSGSFQTCKNICSLIER